MSIGPALDALTDCDAHPPAASTLTPHRDHRWKAATAVSRASLLGDTALTYASRGWQPHQVHGLKADGLTCTCNKGLDCGRSTGKHPVDSGWQHSRRGGSDVSEDFTRRRPWANNIGIVTGAASGFFVLDVDPEHHGDQTLAAMVQAEAPLPATYTVRTGSGGSHFYFRMPDFNPRNSTGRLGKGLDVRADNGQVVAPPSITRKGCYSVEVDVAVAAAPGWLLDRLQPADRTANQLRAGQPGRGTAVGRLAGVLAFLLASPDGSRNTRLHWSACRLGEMVAEGALDESKAVEVLFTAGSDIGMKSAEMIGDRRTGGTIWSGLRTGQRSAGAA